MSKDFDELKEQVARNKSLTDSITQSIVGIADAFARRKDDPVAIQKLRDELASTNEALSAAALAASALANTAASTGAAAGDAGSGTGGTPPAAEAGSGAPEAGTAGGGTPAAPGEGG